MNPENLTASSLDILKLIEGSYQAVYKAYKLKESVSFCI